MLMYAVLYLYAPKVFGCAFLYTGSSWWGVSVL